MLEAETEPARLFRDLPPLPRVDACTGGDGDPFTNAPDWEEAEEAGLRREPDGSCGGCSC